MNTDPQLSLGPVQRTPRLPDLVSERLINAIRDAKLPPGAKLPSERELGEQFGVSRTVIREAIRHLVAKGVLEVQTGSGARVAGIGTSGVSESLSLFLRRRGPLAPDKINEVRETLELQTVRLAAQRASDQQIAEIRAICDQMTKVGQDHEEASRIDVAFHRAIAEATDNELFLVLVDSISDVLLEIRQATLKRRTRVKAALEQHGRIVEALERRDVEGAVAAMRDHLIDSHAAFRRTTSQGSP